MAKINVDAAVGKNSIRDAAAAIARNELGEFLGASATIFKGRTNAENLEALACREAVESARDLNLHRIRVATDCQNVVRSLEERSLGRYAHIIQEVLAAHSDFDELSFSHERRVSNQLQPTVPLIKN
jgi:ribonuclease HI